MPDAFRKVKSGDPLVIPAAAYNAMLDAAVANMRSQGKPSQVRGEQGNHVLVRNESGYPLEQFEILGIEGPAFDPHNEPDAFQQTPVLRGVVPNKDHKGKFVVVQEPAAPGCVVRACVSGLTVARVYTEDSQPKACDIEEGYTYDFTGGSTGGASILWIEGGTGEKWALIRIGHGDVSTLFPVVLKKSGGEEGDEKKATTWRYDVNHALTDESLEKDIDPTAKPHQWRRPAIGRMTQATFGYAHFDKDDKLVVGWINETFVLSSCEEEEDDDA
ncbi:MAG: hypothetical protein FWH27_17260 [Planctomycetaceae bacterium]|nr:hypothetical protein [Planctomycetaceae bacterium]